MMSVCQVVLIIPWTLFGCDYFRYQRMNAPEDDRMSTFSSQLYLFGQRDRWGSIHHYHFDTVHLHRRSDLSIRFREDLSGHWHDALNIPVRSCYMRDFQVPTTVYTIHGLWNPLHASVYPYHLNVYLGYLFRRGCYFAVCLILLDRYISESSYAMLLLS